MKEWISPKPERCDICKAMIDDTFIDGKTVVGPWAIMCKECFLRYGVGLGIGVGQLYFRQGEKFIRLA